MQNICIPFTKGGSLVEWVGYTLNQEEQAKCHTNGFYQSDNGTWSDQYVWRLNKQFKTTLFYDGYSRGRSSIKFDFTDSDGKKFSMFAIDLDAMIKQGVPIKEAHGVFEFVKRGQNYGIRFVKEC